MGRKPVKQSKKKILAYELTNLVHGEEEAKKAQEGARALLQAALTQHICRQLSLQTKTSQKKEQST